MTGIIKMDEKYKAWLSDVNNQFRQSQIKAATKVNEEMLYFYFWLGRRIHFLKNEVKSGNVFYSEVSKDLREILPDIKSFSPTNLKYMQYFYELYRSPQIGDLTKNFELSPQLEDFEKIIFKIPWGHNKLIIDKCKGDYDKAIFYVQKTIENNWSRAVFSCD